MSGVMRLTSPAIRLPATKILASRLSFRHYVATELGYDGGNLKISVNGGAFELVPASAFLFNRYNAQLITEADGNTNPLAGQPAFSGTDGGELAGSWGLSQVDLSALVRECAEFLTPMATQAGVELRLAVADDLVLTGEPAALQRMVTNLLSNAFKYTEAGGRVSMDVVRASIDGVAGVRITCADSGIGIAADEVDKVFTPFFRSSSAEARKRPGTGLGLAIIERVVVGHQGTIRLASTVGQGTTFTVWLPLAPPAEVG